MNSGEDPLSLVPKDGLRKRPNNHHEKQHQNCRGGVLVDFIYRRVMLSQNYLFDQKGKNYNRSQQHMKYYGISLFSPSPHSLDPSILITFK